MFIRKFRTVNDFMDRVRSLDTVLENIESFSSEVKQINGRRDPKPQSNLVTPDLSPQLLATGSGLKRGSHRVTFTESDLEGAVMEADNWSESNRGEEPVGTSELNICCICIERQVECVLSCFHAYCYDCIENWRQRDSTCPLCREQESLSGSFDLLKEPDRQMREQIKQDLMRELSRIIGDLLD